MVGSGHATDVDTHPVQPGPIVGRSIEEVGDIVRQQPDLEAGIGVRVDELESILQSCLVALSIGELSVISSL